MAFFKKTKQNATKTENMQIVLNDKQFNATQSLSTKDVYFRLCACLDREIELVWKRAVFLTAFLIAAFAGYGGLIAAYLGAEKHNAGDFSIVSIAAIGVSVVGMALSVIWIMMAKGSKAWQEHYEKVIECFVARYVKDDVFLRVFASGDYRSLPQLSYKLLDEEKDCREIFPETDKAPFSLFGRKFSVSKIVIGIGQGALLLWSWIAIVHLCYLICHLSDLRLLVVRLGGSNTVAVIGSVIVALLLVLGRKCFTCKIVAWKTAPFESSYFSLSERNVGGEK